MSKPAKKSARERLLEHCDEQVARTDRLMEVSWSKVLNAKTRRLLRAHERPLREALEWAHEHGACNCGEAGEHVEDCPVAVALAILGPRAAKRGGR